MLKSLDFYGFLIFLSTIYLNIKVKNGSCEVHSDFREEITECYDSYSTSKEETEPFGLKNSTALVLFIYCAMFDLASNFEPLTGHTRRKIK